MTHPASSTRWLLRVFAVLLGVGCHDGLPIPQRNQVPTAVARVAGKDGSNVSIDYAGTPVMVTLDGSGSSDPDGHIVTYRWLSGTPAKPTATGAGGSAAAGSGAGASAAGASAAGGSGAGASAAGGSGAGASAAGASAGGASGAAGSATAGSAGAATSGGAGVSAGQMGKAGATGAAGMATATAGSAAVSGSGPWVPPGQPKDWPPDEVMTTVTLDQGVYTFVLWVIDNRGAVSDPSTVTITISAPLDPQVDACVKGAYSGASRDCAICVCQESDTCRMAASQSVCDANCWGLLGCLATMCPDFVPGGDTSCLASKCASFLGGATGATMIGGCIQPACTAQCKP